MKPFLHIIIAITTLLLSNNVMAQSNIQNIVLSSLENNYGLLNNFKENIVIISIFDYKNLDEIKKLDKLAEKYTERNVTFISVIDNLNDDMANSLKNQVLHYQHLSKAENKRVFNTYQTGMYKVFPMHVVLNKKGEVTYKKKGAVNNIEDKLAKRINRLLNTNFNEIKTQELQYTSR